MSSRARSRRGGRRGAHGGEGHEDGERWLLTYADMITLLMALFMVLFSISSVNISKIQALQKSLNAAFSPDNILPGGKAIAKQGSTAAANHATLTREVLPIVPVTPHAQHPRKQRHGSERERVGVKGRSRSRAASNTSSTSSTPTRPSMVSPRTSTRRVQPRGLVIRVLTDRLLFGSGSATLIAQALPAAERDRGARERRSQRTRSAVEGNTDDVPIHGGSLPSNWELSTARASMVVRFLIGRGVFPSRLSASGYADAAPDRHQLERRRQGAQPARGNRAAAHLRERLAAGLRSENLDERRAPDERAGARQGGPSAMLKNKKVLIALVVVLLVAVRGLLDDQAQGRREGEDPGRHLRAALELPAEPQRWPLREAHARPGARARSEQRRVRGRRLLADRRRRGNSSRGSSDPRHRDESDDQREQHDALGRRRAQQGEARDPRAPSEADRCEGRTVLFPDLTVQ